VAALVAQLCSRRVERLLVSAAVNVRYLTGFGGSNGIALISAREQAPHLFFTDFRYETQSAEQVSPLFERQITSAELLEGLARSLSGESNNGQHDDGSTRRLGFDDAALTVKQHARLSELLGAGWELVGCGGLVEALREAKDAHETARIRAAAQLADRALEELLTQGIVGRSERELAIELELCMRRLGASGASFPSIVASGPYGALPHAEPRAEPVPRGALVTIDWGCVLEGYCSDCTRTYATGEVGDEAREVHELVRRAQQAALDELRPGPSGREIDTIARQVIEDAGYGERFGHGLGHGVGMEVHEGPRLSRTAGEQRLQAGNVVTVEPGIYIPGRFGVRIEDLAVLTPDGHELLTGLPKELTVID
jgi:Xaa-Pro aminopeptidase